MVIMMMMQAEKDMGSDGAFQYSPDTRQWHLPWLAGISNRDAFAFRVVIMQGGGQRNRQY